VHLFRGSWILALLLAGCGASEVWDAKPTKRTEVYKVAHKLLAECAYSQIGPRVSDLQRTDEKEAARLTSAVQNWTLTIRDAPYARRFDRRDVAGAIFEDKKEKLPTVRQEPNKAETQGSAPTTEVMFESSVSGSVATAAENFVWNSLLLCLVRLPGT
jgi:hypothetical protein